MFVKLDIPDSEKKKINLLTLKDLWRKYRFNKKQIKPTWVEGLMQEIDPYRFYLELDVPSFSLEVLTDLKKFINSCKDLEQLPIVLPNGTKFIIRKAEKLVHLYDRLKDEI
ncbi:MAG TPA: hypothetical protein VJ110_02700 [Candidatus Nanoarchaeia archaeon]|nr:hypothetical protein [Candidatus Nanoarchaeia archaeon]